MKNLLVVGVLVLVAVFGFSDISFATGSGSMPYETALSDFKDSLTGPVGTVIGILALFGAAAGFIFGSELSGIIKSMLGVCLAIGIMLSGNTIMTKWFNSKSSGTIIPIEIILSDKILDEFGNE